MIDLSQEDKDLNRIAKKTGGVLKAADEKVKWTDFFILPGGQRLVCVGFKDGKVKYADVTGKSPFKAAALVIRCMDDYCLTEQFVSKRKQEQIQSQISDAAKDAAYNVNEIMDWLKSSDLSDEVFFEFFKKVQSIGLLPDFFLTGVSSENIKPCFEKYIISDYPTGFDISVMNLVMRECKEKK